MIAHYEDTRSNTFFSPMKQLNVKHIESKFRNAISFLDLVFLRSSVSSFDSLIPMNFPPAISFLDLLFFEIWCFDARVGTSVRNTTILEDYEIRFEQYIWHGFSIFGGQNIYQKCENHYT
jgi:hypothetical protein